MSKKEVVETIYGKLHKYEIVKSPGGMMSSTSFSIHRDGSHFKGSYSSLADAVAAAKREG